MDMQTWRDSRGRADNATTVLREAFAALGVPDHVQQHLRPVITHSGTAFVHIGMLQAEHVKQIAEALRAAATSRSLLAASKEAD